MVEFKTFNFPETVISEFTAEMKPLIFRLDNEIFF